MRSRKVVALVIVGSVFVLLGLALVVSNLGAKQKPRLGFITDLGTHEILKGKSSIRLFMQGDAINYRFTTGMSSFGPTEAPIEKGSKWFAYVESPDKVWVYDGKNDIVLLENAGTNCGIYSLSYCGEALRKRIPAGVVARLPHLLTNETKAPAQM
jgi:hypothetical protein